MTATRVNTTLKESQYWLGQPSWPIKEAIPAKKTRIHTYVPRTRCVSTHTLKVYTKKKTKTKKSMTLEPTFFSCTNFYGISLQRKQKLKAESNDGDLCI